MGEEVNMSDYGEDNRILDWELELTDLTPLSQSLIPPQLASAFNIKPELRRTVVDVNRASEETFSSLRRVDSAEEADSPLQGENSNSNSLDDQSARTLKKPRLVWTPQLHKRFVDVVSHLGIKNAVPKTIMQMMNVEGLTRENVASHLQKYRLYLKRMQGLSNEGPSSSDPLFASTPIPASLHESGRNGHMPMPVQMPMQMQYGQMMMHMPMFHHGHMGMAMGNHPNPYGMMQQYDTNATPSDK